jgi:hypothetical protein
MIYIIVCKGKGSIKVKKGFLISVVFFGYIFTLNGNTPASCENGLFTKMDSFVIKDESKRDFTYSSYGQEEKTNHLKIGLKR